MKSLRLLSLFIAVVMLATVALIIPTAAEELPTVYVTEINKAIAAANGNVFTKAFNGTNTIKSSEANFRWTVQIVCKPTDKANVFELAENPIGNLTNGKDDKPDQTVTIPEGGFIYSAHVDDSDAAKANKTFDKSSENQKRIKDLKKGDKVTISGIDIAKGTKTANAVIYIGVKTDATPSSSTATSSKTTSSQPKTGDNGILYFAIAAIISLAGAATLSIRKRSR